MNNNPVNNHVTERLTDYLLGEVTVRERDAIRGHLVICRQCADEETAIRRSLTSVEEALQSDRLAPDDFTERVMRRIRDAARIEIPLTAAAPSHRFRTSRRLRVWAVAVTFVLIGTLLFHFGFLSPRPTVSDTMAPVTLTLPVMLAVYQAVSHPADATSEVAMTSPVGIAKALTRRVGFRVAPVDLAAQGASTRSARVSRLLGRSVAVSVLAFHGKRLALYQMQARGVSLPVMPVMNAAGKRILCGRTQGCHLVVWRSGGRLFVLAGEVSDRDLVMLASAFPEHGEAA